MAYIKSNVVRLVVVEAWVGVRGAVREHISFSALALLNMAQTLAKSYCNDVIDPEEISDHVL